MYIDVHNHVIPDAVLRLAEQDSRLGISAGDGTLRSPHHVPFALQPAFHSPAEKLADLAGREQVPRHRESHVSESDDAHRGGRGCHGGAPLARPGRREAGGASRALASLAGRQESWRFQ